MWQSWNTAVGLMASAPRPRLGSLDGQGQPRPLVHGAIHCKYRAYGGLSPLAQMWGEAVGGAGFSSHNLGRWVAGRVCSHEP